MIGRTEYFRIERSEMPELDQDHEVLAVEFTGWVARQEKPSALAHEEPTIIEMPIWVVAYEKDGEVMLDITFPNGIGGSRKHPDTYEAKKRLVKDFRTGCAIRRDSAVLRIADAWVRVHPGHLRWMGYLPQKHRVPDEAVADILAAAKKVYRQALAELERRKAELQARANGGDTEVDPKVAAVLQLLQDMDLEQLETVKTAIEALIASK